MDTNTRLELLKEFAQEIVTEPELQNLLETKSKPIAYDGFEPSGIAPLHFGLFRSINVQAMLKAKVKVKLYLADYFAMINNKLGGDLERIRTCGKYFEEVWKAAGIDTDKVDFVWAKDVMDNMEYWDRLLKIGRHITTDRTLRATTIMGRKQGEKLHVAQLFYPVMQVNDIFHLNVDICQLGMEQRRANMLARDVAPKLKLAKPVAVHHHILTGLQGVKKAGSEEETMMASKMSKSDPLSCIYMHDSYAQLKKKINKAYCPEKTVEGNPLLEYSKHMIFRALPAMEISRPEKFGGDLTFESYQELETAFRKGDLHPVDLKSGVTDALNELIDPVRSHFEKNKKANKLYEEVKSFKITR